MSGERSKAWWLRPRWLLLYLALVFGGVGFYAIATGLTDLGAFLCAGAALLCLWIAAKAEA